MSLFKLLALSRNCEQHAMENIKKDFGIRGYPSQGNFTITGALFYNGDGIVQEMPMLIALESWADLMAHVHKIFIRTA